MSFSKLILFEIFEIIKNMTSRGMETKRSASDVKAFINKDLEFVKTFPSLIIIIPAITGKTDAPIGRNISFNFKLFLFCKNKRIVIMLNVEKQTIKMLLEPERKITKPQRIKTITENLFGKAFI